jgi:dihydroflavonol-4-reductase
LKKAIVTGASGFLGSYLCINLAKNGYHVVGLKHNKEAVLFNKLANKQNVSGIEWMQADILNPEELLVAFKDADVVFHCAAKVSFDSGDVDALMDTNIKGTQNVVNACLETGVKSLVYASSVAALGRKSKDNTITENSEWVESAYNSPYSVSKYYAELEVWRGVEEGLQVAVINPGIIIGAGDGKSGSNILFHHVKSGKKFYPTGVNGFVGVEDVAEMMRLMLEKEVFGKRLIAVAENIPYQNILSMAAKEYGMKVPSAPFAGFVYHTAYALSRFCEFFRIPFPYPSSGLKNTTSSNYYMSVNNALEPYFVYTDLETVVHNSIKNL